MVPARVSLITIGARDLPSLRAFYQRLGWAETDVSSDSYAVFRTAGVLLSLFPLQELLHDAGLSADETVQGFKGITLAINVEQPEQVDSLIEAVRTVGGRVTREPSDAFWGGRTAYFFDPENNAWEVAWNPTAVFDERGAMLSF
ncbi:VOC family protein [Cohnella candidum]|uniref:Glyoxalase n=1 Tax=Cohnella candidum TaxID=2674991 RepID=A0A3G3JV50_9BACL|nr:VOC family protein [Cohnella candidum]AYQ72105.1 glyoxalase [Cohnella candidum]